jgi:flagellar hook-associated protein 1 FlgK
MPASGINPGLAGEIAVNPNVDPSQGGNANLLRDGGISNPGSATYTYNTSGAASYTDRINQLIDNLSQAMSFNQTANADANDTLSGYAAASVSWLEAARQDASTQLTYKNTVVSQSSTALSNVTGVNLDTEMSKMLDIEHSYQASAELINTINTMFGSLFQAVQ